MGEQRVVRPVADQESHGAEEAQERRSFSEAKGRSIALLRQAIAALEHEIGSPPVVYVSQSEGTRASVDARSVPASADGIKAVWYRLKRGFQTRPL